MGKYAPMTWQEVEAILEMDILKLSLEHRMRFQSIRVPFRNVPVDSYPTESVIVVAEHDNKILYYSNIEGGWELEVPTASGRIHDRACNQFELSHIMYQLFGEPEEC